MCHGRVGPETGFIGQARKRHPSGGTQSSTRCTITAGQARAGLNLGVVNEAKEINKL